VQLFYPGTSLTILLPMEIRLSHSQTLRNSHYHFLVPVKFAVSQVCFSSPILNHPEVYGELVATTVVSDICCVVLHCHAERSHLMTCHFFGLTGLGGLVGRFYYQGHLFDERSGRLGV
jgi:hypothetical protein